MPQNHKIIASRLQHGWTKEQAAAKANIPVYIYEEMEKDDHELLFTIQLNAVKRLCSVFELNLLDLMNLDCDFCTQKAKFGNLLTIPRNKIIKARKTQMNLPDDKLAQLLNLTRDSIMDLQTDEDFLESWPIFAICDLSNSIKIPVQILINVKCPICNR